eukprot:CAMPEP_0169210182 /NCGR_PEP_ID=MMETSP1016-20121227/15075_1 /TAXON_ID=342587 /ORGANISM="Karlodinium micrum, Strain CCMP2283" /LENGTH=384 /DNA_ID=CAMNT_0009287699 /DNA_START=31 /DNA_END=1185 /DNA_ORIENTATION=-
MAAHCMRLDVSDQLLEQYDLMRNIDAVFHALESVEFPISSRKNVRKAHDTKPVYGMCLGMVSNWVGIPMTSRATRERPNLAKLLTAFVKHEVPDFEFTSIQVNKDYAAALHVDKNNAGTSMIIGLGDYSGGQLWIDDGGQYGRIVDLRNRWFKFDGNNAHGVVPFRGRRYTLVYFTRSATMGGSVGENPESGDAQRLSDLGFALPRACPEELHFPPAVVRVQMAHYKFQEFCIHTLRRGGPGRIRLRLRFSDGCTVQVAVPSSAPLKLLMEGIAERFHDHVSYPLQLMVGSLFVLPSDTPRGLSLSSKCTIDVVNGSLADGDRSPRDGAPYPSVTSSIPRRSKTSRRRQIDGLTKGMQDLEPQASKRIKLEVAHGVPVNIMCID